ncbi:MAG: hypothetical protein JW741_18365 [Sedimentisphaerales bacterium]|nr:hypothetical protein [Sedimentisphaerales bacterium]
MTDRIVQLIRKHPRRCVVLVVFFIAITFIGGALIERTFSLTGALWSHATVVSVSLLLGVLAGVYLMFAVFALHRQDWWFRELAARFVLPSIFAIGGLILGLAKAPSEMTAHWAVLVTTLGACCGWVVDDILRWQHRERRQDKTLAWIKQHLEGLSVSHNLHTDNNFMEELLKSTESIRGRARWLVPLFLSRKFSRELSEKDKVQIALDDVQYSQLLEQLIPYCSRSIKMTCPYPPDEWFRRLFKDDSVKRDHALAGNMEFAHFPPHSQKFLTLNVETKQRLVIISKEQRRLFESEINPLKTFLKCCNSSYNIDTKFVYQPILCNGCEKEGQCTLWTRDFQIWDDAISVEYDHAGPQIVELQLKPDELSQMFTKCWNRADRKGAYSREEMQNLVSGLKDNEKLCLDRWKPEEAGEQDMEKNGQIKSSKSTGDQETLAGQEEEQG